MDLGPTEGNALVAEREPDLALVASYGEPLHPPSGVSAGVAVAFLPRHARGVVPGTVTRELAEPALFRRVHAGLPAHSPTELAEVFLGLFQDVCAEHGGTEPPVR